ncbi:hypothetical protein IscW_ISCW007857 [Ixodes scapularis]|uniref:Uncharacterized protein n=1 Tax=Ixodes scapularis TaxID=6945 RepID=B7PVI3_IXOSC|nr:hypothetical protein IscW_ISCW007857 [Ixodes scapularis]|eukprot:XP_002408012.1 hypothetical protein IscW_ISCW007857 [Ixodes scapularis]
MRLSGPPKKRRDAAPNRIPPMWTSARAPAVTPPVWRFPPLRSPFFVPAPFLAGGADGGPPPSMSQGGSGGAAAAAAAAKRDKAKIVQFEWNGCTFYRYIPDGGKLGGGRLMPGEPPFGRPRGFEWQQRGPRSQSRRRKQVVPPLRAAPTAPPWSTPGLPERKPYGAAPFRPRDNPRIPRKDNKAPSSHLHLPPFLVGAAAAADKPTTSGSSTKSQSPASTTSNLLGPPPRSGIFQCRPKDTAFPFSLTDEERNCMSEDPPTSSSEIYLDSLVSNGTSSSSPKDDAQGKLRRNGTDGKTDRTALLMEDLDILLKDCSPIKSADEKSSCESNPNTSSTPCLDPISNDDSGSSRDEFLDVPKLAKDLGDTISTTSDVILINFAEDTTTLKEHLDGIVADYKSKAGIDTADSGGNDLNVLESYAGSSLTESNAPVLKPADASPVLHDAALEDAAAGDYSQDEENQRSLEYTGYTVAHGSGPGVTGSSDDSKSYCNSCGVYSPCCNPMDSEGVVRVCSCKTRLARKRDVCKAVADVALKEEYRDPEIVPCFAEESVEYLLLESEEEEYEEVKRRVATGQPGEERKRYPENSNSWNKRDTISDQEPEQNEAGASRGLIYDCPWWIHDHAEDAMCKKLVKEDSSSVGFTRELAPAALNPWSLLTAQNKESGLDCGGPSGEGTNPWIPFLAGPKVGVMMSSGDHHGSAEARPTRSDADFSTLYMEGQPRKPLLKQHWAPLNMTPEELRARGLDRDSLSFYEFPMNEQQDTHAQSLSLETLVGSNHQDAASTSPAEGGRLAEGELRRGSLNGKATGSPSDSQYCEVELYAPVNKSGPAVCTVVVPSHPTSDADGSKGDVLVDGGPGSSTPPDDVVDSCGDKKAAENKPMGKIRTRFRDFFWKHK